MTSKEALKKIYNTGANMVIGTPLDNFFKEEIKAIAKDLEVLENLRNHIEKIDIITSYCEMDIKTIKEWLKEDKEWGQYE